MLGFAMGTMILAHITYSFAPSTRADSRSSSGICMKYCRIRKVPVIVMIPGRISVRCVPISPILLNITNLGISVTWLGIIIVAR